MNAKRLKGVVVPVLTPFGPGDRVAEKPFRAQLRFLMQNRVHGLFPLGTLGEGILLSVDERKRVTDICVEESRDQIPVIMHTGALTTREAVELTRYAQTAGAAAAAVVSPFFFRLDELSLETHYRTVLEAVPDFPIYLYNIPASACNTISPALAGWLARDYPHLHGIKDSSATVTRVQEFLAATPPEFVVLTGSYELTVPVLAVGGHGVVASLANVFPDLIVELCEACWREDWDRACELQERAITLRDACQAAPHGMSFKTALELTRGIRFGGSRPPLRDSTPEERRTIQARLSSLGIL
jgi:4-hydroxy-tetrahydrodipicolinate synthase